MADDAGLLVQYSSGFSAVEIWEGGAGFSVAEMGAWRIAREFQRGDR